MPTHYDLILRGGTCLFPWGPAQADIGVASGRIVALDVPANATASEIFEARGLYVLPGLIDAHVHLRDPPGDPAIESVHTGTRAAVLGGFAAVFEMPNTSPPLASAETLNAHKADVAERMWCDLGIHIGATKTNIPSLAALERAPGICAIKVFAGSSTGDLMVEDDAHIEAVMRSGTRRIAYHAEDEYRLRARKPLFAVGSPYGCHCAWRDPEAAFLGTRRITALARKTGRPAHILHVSTEEEWDYLRDWRDLVTTEVLVNHLTQVAPECYEALGGYAVMNPPIRDRRHYEAGWAALRDGRVDVISSDHAPHPKAAKERPWPQTASGLTGVQTAVPIMLNHVNAGRLSLARMVDVMCAGPARVYGATTKGRIAVGWDADFTIVDLKRQRTIEASWIATPVKWTPFDGTRVTGWPEATIVRGRVVMRNDEVLGAPSGRFVTFHS